jgi:nucleotide-binding universal stress UspA family protein
LILIAYDGSPDSQAAVKCAAELLPGQAVTVLTVWEPVTDVMARAGAGMLTWPEQDVLDGIDAVSEHSARTRAEQGAQLAHGAGLPAQARVGMRGTTIAETILVAAGDVDAGVIVLGTRGRSGLKSLLLGSVSHAVLQHADRPVMVVPSPEVAARRTDGRH